MNLEIKEDFPGKIFQLILIVPNLHLILPNFHFVETRYSHSAVFNINLNYLFSSSPLIFKIERIEQSAQYVEKGQENRKMLSDLY